MKASDFNKVTDLLDTLEIIKRHKEDSGVKFVLNDPNSCAPAFTLTNEQSALVLEVLQKDIERSLQLMGVEIDT